MTDRPTFYFKTKNSPVRAGGVLFYRYSNINNKEEYHLLLTYSRDIYEDFGGCSDNKDKSIEDMVAREVEEESNGIFSKEYVLDKIKNEIPIYIKLCKYVMYFIQIDEYYDPEVFGNREICDNFSRTVEWINYLEFKKFQNNKLNPRISCPEIQNHMKILFA